MGSTIPWAEVLDQREREKESREDGGQETGERRGRREEKEKERGEHAEQPPSHLCAP